MDKIINFESLNLRLANDKELLIEILQMFIEIMPKHIDHLKTAIEKKNPENIKMEAHTLKGAAGNISAEKLANTARLIETTGKDGNFSNAELLFPALEKEYKELETLIIEQIN